MAIGNTSPPTASTSAATLWIVPGSFAWGSSDLAAMTILACAVPAVKAMARPMPRLPPLMNMVRPFSVFTALLPLRLAHDTLPWRLHGEHIS
jgi:hypothetical protein